MLFSNNEEEGKKACRALQKARIPFAYPPCTEPDPLLIVGLLNYRGLQRIKIFIKSGLAKEIKEKYKHEI
jgi:hypothetical protein